MFDNIKHQTDQRFWDDSTGKELPGIINRMGWQERGQTWTATGYGAKIPTAYMVRLNNRWHRVYCRIFSNIGTCYIVSKGEKHVIRNHA